MDLTAIPYKRIDRIEIVKLEPNDGLYYLVVEAIDWMNFDEIPGISNAFICTPKRSYLF
jgi:hypothetical protein